MPILVTGATGNVGAEVLRRLVDGGEDVIAARRPGDTAPRAVDFDFLDPATFDRAFAGITTLFLVRPPAISNVRRDLVPALEAARRCGVEHVVFLSLQGADKNSFVPHAKVEAWLAASGMQTTFLRPSFFMQNLSTTHRSDIRDRDAIMAPAGGGATAFIDVLDIADPAVAVLREPERYHGAGDRGDLHDRAARARRLADDGADRDHRPCAADVRGVRPPRARGVGPRAGVTSPLPERRG